MKLKKLSLLASAIAVAFSITPLAANAQKTNSNSPQRVSQANPARSGPQLDLSQQQIAKIREIRSNTRTQIQNVFTPQQRKKIQDDLKAGKQPQEAFGSVKFSVAQQNQLRSIIEKSQLQMEGVLDAKQKKILAQWRAQQRSRMQKK